MYESENKGLSGILKISPRAELSCEQGNKSLLGVPGRQDSGDSGTQVKFLSLGSERLELIPARTLPQAFVTTPPPSSL